jgi:hypothetical protein
MLNEINLLQILYIHLEYLFFSLMKVKMVKFIQGGPCSINGPKLFETSFFETLYIEIRQLVLVTLEHFTYINS